MPVKTKTKNKVKPNGEKVALKSRKPTKPVASKTANRKRQEAAVKGKWVWLSKEGNRNMRDLLGGKGAGLAEMTNAGLPVPPALPSRQKRATGTARTAINFPRGMWDQVLDAIKKTEKAAGKKFGDAKKSVACFRCVRARNFPCPA